MASWVLYKSSFIELGKVGPLEPGGVVPGLLIKKVSSLSRSTINNEYMFPLASIVILDVSEGYLLAFFARL
jgi:hypothetical protein